MAIGLDQHTRTLTLKNGRIAATLIAALVLFAWPTDQVFFVERPHIIRVMAFWRAGIIGTNLLVIALASWRGAPRYAYAASIFFGAIQAAMTGAEARLCGVAEWPYYGLLMPLASTAMVMPPLPRLLSTSTLSGAFFGAYAIVGPGAPEVLTPTLLVNAACVAGICFGFGHAYYRIVRLNFLQQAELAQINQDLEARIEARASQLRRLTAHIQSRREEERRRLATEIHDETGQLLTALRMEVDLARRDHRDPPRLPPILDRMDEVLTQVLASTRALVSELRPKILDDLGLSAAAEWYLARYKSRASFAVNWSIHPELGNLSVEASIALFRALQESLTNVARHAHASAVYVSLSAEDSRVVLQVRDDGLGFDDRELVADGFGVLGMKERARALGGALTVRRAAPQGTLLTIELPLGAPSSSSP